MSHAIAEMVSRLRGTSSQGLLFANGGYATHNHTLVLSGAPTGALFPQDFDFQDEADRRRGDIPELDEAYSGDATIETYTVHYEREGSPRSGVIVARTPDGKRSLALVPRSDAATISFLTSGTVEPIGCTGWITRNEDGIGHWCMPAPPP